MKTITILALLVLTSALQARVLLPPHDTKYIVELLRRTVATKGIREIQEVTELAARYRFKSEQNFTISQNHYDFLLKGGSHKYNPQEGTSFLKELAAKANKIDGEDVYRINLRDFDLAWQNAKKNADPQTIEKIDKLAHSFTSAAFEYGDGIDYRALDTIMIAVAKNNNPDAIDLLVKLADDKQHPLLYLQTFSRYAL